jgi:nucleotide-binding universal stress UspA family protein
MPQVVEKDEEEATRHLETIKTKASKDGIDCEIVVMRGEEPYQEIVDAAAMNQVDMIIMGRHGRTGLLKLMMGSVTARVIGHAPCNVLVIPPDAKVECRNILVATDGSRFSEMAAHEAICIAKQCKSPLIAISVASSDTEIASAKENVKKIMDAAAKEGVKAEGLTSRGKPYEVIVQIARQRHADLIVIGSHGRTGIERLLMGSVTERVIGHSETAVLVVKTKSIE